MSEKSAAENSASSERVGAAGAVGEAEKSAREEVAPAETSAEAGEALGRTALGACAHHWSAWFTGEKFRARFCTDCREEQRLPLTMTHAQATMEGFPPLEFAKFLGAQALGIKVTTSPAEEAWRGLALAVADRDLMSVGLYLRDLRNLPPEEEIGREPTSVVCIHCSAVQTHRVCAVCVERYDIETPPAQDETSASPPAPVTRASLARGPSTDELLARVSARTQHVSIRLLENHGELLATVEADHATRLSVTRSGADALRASLLEVLAVLDPTERPTELHVGMVVRSYPCEVTVHTVSRGIAEGHCSACNIDHPLNNPLHRFWKVADTTESDS